MEKVTLLETALDHLTGEELGNALTELNNSPLILDALFLPGIGKKNRPAGLLQVLCRPESELEVKDLVFRHTHALGLRRSIMERYVLPREAAEMEIDGETVAAKAHQLENMTYLRPEADAASSLAKKRRVGMPALRFKKRK